MAVKATRVNITSALPPRGADVSGTIPILTADPVNPQNDTMWGFRDGGSPQALSLRWRIAGVTYDLPLGSV